MSPLVNNGIYMTIKYLHIYIYGVLCHFLRLNTFFTAGSKGYFFSAGYNFFK